MQDIPKILESSYTVSVTGIVSSSNEDKKYMAIFRAKFQRVVSVQVRLCISKLGMVRLETFTQIVMQKSPSIFCLRLPFHPFSFKIYSLALSLYTYAGKFKFLKNCPNFEKILLLTSYIIMYIYILHQKCTRIYAVQ